jgi:hypothetical protein
MQATALGGWPFDDSGRYVGPESAGLPPEDPEVQYFTIIDSHHGFAYWVSLRRDTPLDADPEVIVLRLEPDQAVYHGSTGTLRELRVRFDERIVSSVRAELVQVLERRRRSPANPAPRGGADRNPPTALDRPDPAPPGAT